MPRRNKRDESFVLALATANSMRKPASKGKARKTKSMSKV
jgi:hypothetical protein